MEARKLQSEPQPFDLSLRIRHPSIDPDEISDELKVEAEYSFRAGDPRPSGSGISSVHGESYWVGPVGTDDTVEVPLREFRLAQQRLAAATLRSLGWALFLRVTHFLNAHAALFRRIKSEGGQASLLVSILPGQVESFSIGPEVSRILADLGITIEFDLTDEP
jgi:hypothetical protein